MSKLPFVDEVVSKGAPSDDPLEALRDAEGAISIGRYRLTIPLGSGGMGVVYEGTAPGSRTDQRLAIKVVRSAQFASPEQLVRFRQEIASLARIRHDNVCRLIDFGHEGPIDYLVMEYVNGRAFDDWLEEEQPETGRIAQVVAKVARAIDHIHTQGIIHRDLNAHNVMVDADDRPVVMDFGLAHDVDGDERITASGVAIGTPSFMSPEATLGKKGTVGPWTDVWGLGALLYLGLTGQPPHKGESSHEIFTAINGTDVTPPRNRNSAVPPLLDRITTRALQRLREDRYGDARAFATDLETYLQGEQVHVRLPGFFRRSLRLCRRHIWLTLTVFVAVTLLSFLVGGAWINSVRQWGHWNQATEVTFESGGSLEQLGFEVWPVRAGQVIVPESVRLTDNGLVIDMSAGGQGAPVVRTKVPGSQRGIRIDIDLTFGEVDDALEVVVNAADVQQLDWWELPPGWQVKLQRLEEGSVRVGWRGRGGHPSAASRYALPMIDGNTRDVRVSLIRTDDHLQILLDGERAVHLQEPLATATEDHEWLVLRTFQPTTYIRRVNVYRHEIARYASPLIAAEALRRRGQLADAMGEYESLTLDYAGSSVGEQAAVQLVSIALERFKRGEPVAVIPHIHAYHERYPNGASRNRVLEFAADLAWNQERFDDALDILEEVIRAEERNRYAVELVESRRALLSRDQAHRVARLLASVRDLRVLNLENLQLDSVDFLAGRDFGTINLKYNRLRNLDSLASVQTGALHLTGNQLTDLSGLKGQSFETLSLNQNPALQDLLPLREVSVSGSLSFEACTSLAMVPQLATEGGPRSLDISETAISDISGLQLGRLESLNLSDTTVSDISALRDAPELNSLIIGNAPVVDLSPLQGHDLRSLSISDNQNVVERLPRDLALHSITLYNCGSVSLGRLLPMVEHGISLNNCSVVLPPVITSETLYSLNLGNSGITSWPRLNTPNLSKLELDANPITGPTSLNGAPGLAFLSLLNFRLAEPGNLIGDDSSSLAFAFDRHTFPAEYGDEVRRFLDVRGHHRQGLALAALDLVEADLFDHLRYLAWQEGGQHLLALPGPFSREELDRMLNRSGAGLAALTSEAQMEGLADLSAWLGGLRVSYQVGPRGRASWASMPALTFQPQQRAVRGEPDQPHPEWELNRSARLVPIAADRPYLGGVLLAWPAEP